MHLLAGEKPDILAIETVPLLQEIRVFLELISEPEYQKLGVPVWFAVAAKDEKHLGSGEHILELVKLIQQYSSPLVCAVGINCTPPQFVSKLVLELSVLPIPILAYANSGETYDPENKEWI